MERKLYYDGHEHILQLDDQDGDLLTGMKIYKYKSKNLVANRDPASGKFVYLHRLVAGRMADGDLGGAFVRFVNGDGLDCRRRNLRVKGMLLEPKTKSIPTNTVRVRWRLSKSTVKKLRILAIERDMTVSDCIEDLVA